MSEWISIEAAAEKYRLEKEYIRLWVEMKKVAVSYADDVVTVDDDSLQEFIKRTKLGITSEYIDALEQLCMEKNKSCRLYVSLLDMRDQELMAMRGQGSRLDGVCCYHYLLERFARPQVWIMIQQHSRFSCIRLVS